MSGILGKMRDDPNSKRMFGLAVGVANLTIDAASHTHAIDLLRETLNGRQGLASLTRRRWGMVPLLMGDGSFGEQHFGSAEFGDKRRTRRIVDLANTVRKHPGGSFPHKINDPKELKSFYRLMDAGDVTHESVLKPHYERTQRVMQELGGVVLIVHDTTELDYTTKFSLSGLGQIGNGNRRGYLCHNSLAVVPGTREVIGLANQILHCRPVEKTDETLAERRVAKDRESRLWVDGVTAIGAAPAGVKAVDVCDRGADTFEFLEYEVKQGRRFVVRSKHDRAIQQPRTTNTDKRLTRHTLHSYARSLTPLGSRTISIVNSPGRGARMAEVAIAASKVTIQAPKVKRGEHSDEPVELYVVRVWEIGAPASAGNEKPLEWILLTNEPVEAFEDVCEVVGWYECRWVVEEFHKAKKTGCQIEQLQFTAKERLEPAIALISVIAMTLMALRDASRRSDAKERPASEYLHSDYIAVLSVWRHKRPISDWSVHDFYYALARLGGHQNRRRDHPPGWLVLWRGWETLQAMVLGAEIERRKGERCG